MEELVEQRRASGRRNSTQLPDEVLDECEKSFKAAQELVAKASTAFYADTALMALICRHDEVLWLANVTTPGERQFYALALLQRLFSHLPSDWHIGVLYDIFALDRFSETRPACMAVEFGR